MRRVMYFLALVLLPVTGWAEAQIHYTPPSGSTNFSFTTQLFAPAADNCSAVPYSFTGDDNTGVCSSAADTVGFITGGTTRFSLNTSAVTSTLPVNLSSAAASIFIYNTADQATNYERLEVKWAANYAYLQTVSAGSGTARPLVINAASTPLYLRVAGGGWQIQNNTERNFIPDTTDASDMGAASYQIRNSYLARSVQGSKSKALTDATATAFVRVSVADDDYEGCAIVWTAYAEDADSDARQTRTGRTAVAILNNSGTEAAVFSTGDEAVAVTAGTLTCTFDGNSASANTIDLRANCDTSLNADAETLTFEYRLDCPSTLTVTPQ